MSDDLDRPVFYDSLGEHAPSENMFCNRGDLSNEASVESFFVMRLLDRLGYEDSEIKTKESVEALEIPEGRETEEYKPDYVLQCDGKPRVVLDAKSPKEQLDDWILQCQGYAMALNRRYTDENPVHYYVLTNGLDTKIFRWDEVDPVMSIAFGELQPEAVGWEELKERIAASNARAGWEDEILPSSKDTMEFRKPDMDNVRGLFQYCHDIIWKAEKLSPQAAFFEFVKLMFVKLYCDRQLHQDEELCEMIERREQIPTSEVRFRVGWIEDIEESHDNPVDALLFRSLMNELEMAVERGNKKRIFPEDESIDLSPGTIKEVVRKVENIDMWGIDEDLNGRLFEEFLSSTMRGEDLGQYFTPRSIVKFMTRLAGLEANRNAVDRCLDACCGTGGFLIEILTIMRNKIREDDSLTSEERAELLREVADESIYGIDAGKEPLMAQIARINMYLHGDGGSRIYGLDALDKEISVSSAATSKEEHYVEEFRSEVEDGLEFDVVLTNPPFAMDYSANRPEEDRILENYDLRGFNYTGSRSDGRKRLKTSVMFLERYHDLLRDGGELITVMDDSVLSSRNFGYVRDWIREHYIIKAVISLPGDAFQRVGARQKTSVLYLKKKEDPEEQQPGVFMDECIAMGLEDKPQRTPETERREAREATDEEKAEMLEKFRAFQRGEKGPWIVDPDDVRGRLDVKYCRPHPNPAKDLWEDEGLELRKLGDVVRLVEEEVRPDDAPNDEFTFLEISYEGEPREGKNKLGRDIGYSTVKVARPGDIIVSHINAVHGSVCILPEELRDVVISKEYSILRVEDDEQVDPQYVKILLRSPEFRAMMLSEVTGGGRHRVEWETIRDLEIPIIKPEEQRALSDEIREAERMREEAEQMERRVVEDLEDQLGLQNEEAEHRLQAGEPPQ